MWDKRPQAGKAKCFIPAEFQLAEDGSHCLCPAGKRPGHESHTDRMKVKIDSDTGKQVIAARFAAVEPVFGNLRHNKRLTRFTLRSQAKVDGQWKLYCLVHNIEKLAHHAYAQ